MTNNTSSSRQTILQTGTNELEIITFFLRRYDEASDKFIDTYYGINAAKVSELVAVPSKLTEIANSPECVEGIFLLREKTIPLINISTWFRYTPDSSDEAKRKWTVIVAELNSKFFGFLCHGVDKVYRTSWQSISPPHELIASSKSITGTVLIENRLIQMIDFENITASIDPSMKLKGFAKVKEASADYSESGKVVVIADDSKVIRDMLKSVLVEANYKVVEKSDGQLCWEYLQQVKAAGPVHDKVYIVISDIEMPRMDGHNLCLRIKEDPAFAKIPVILFSSMINDGLHKKGLKVGADAQITKPQLNMLVGKMTELVKKYQG